MQERLILKNIYVKYGDFTVLEEINLIVNPGEVIFITGQNGTGKTTLIKTIAGLINFSSGEIFKTKKLSYVPQNEKADFDFPAKVKEIILTGTQRPGKLFYTRSDKKSALKSMQTLGILNLSNRNIKTLSGGQLKRVFLARALCGEPELLLLDEPCAGLDIESHEFLYEVLRKIRDSGTSIIIVTHAESDLDEIKPAKVINISNGRIYNRIS